MSRTVTRHCDRCRAQIEAGGAIVKVEAGELTRRLPELLDLCTSCTDAFVQFFQAERRGGESSS
jgi:hypothetical protein